MPEQHKFTCSTTIYGVGTALILTSYFSLDNFKLQKLN